MTFKSRESIQSTKTFDKSEDATSFVAVISQSLKQQGFTVQELSVREGYDYDHYSPKAMSVDAPEPSKCYFGSVVAYKETVPAEETSAETPATDTVN